MIRCLITSLVLVQVITHSAALAENSDLALRTPEITGLPPAVTSPEPEHTSDTPKLNSVYGEASTDSRTKNGVFYIRLSRQLMKPKDLFELYIGVAASQDTRSDTQNIYNDNFVAPLIGIRADLFELPVQLFAEQRYVVSAFERPETPKQYWESRLGFTGSTWHEFYEERLFNEFYGEAVYSNRNEGNISGIAFDKFGYQYRLENGLTPQVYLEGFIKRDKLGYFYENLQEARVGARLRYFVGSFGFGISGHYAFGQYTDKQYKDPNPYNSTYNQWVGLLVFGGDF